MNDLDLAAGRRGQSCDRRSCMIFQSFQRRDLAMRFGDIKEEERSEMQNFAHCYPSTTVNLATTLVFFSRVCSLDSLEMLESKHRLVTALSEESCPRFLQIFQKRIKGQRIGLGAEKRFPMSEACSLPINAKSLVGTVTASSCGSHNPLHMSIVEASSQRMMIDKAFSVPNCVLPLRVSHHSQQLQRKVWGAVTGPRARDFSDTWEK